MMKLLTSIIERLFGRLYLFRHERGMTHCVRAKNEESAKRKMRAFIQSRIVGDWQLWYYPEEEAIEREMSRCQIVEGNQ